MRLQVKEPLSKPDEVPVLIQPRHLPLESVLDDFNANNDEKGAYPGKCVVYTCNVAVRGRSPKLREHWLQELQVQRYCFAEQKS